MVRNLEEIEDEGDASRIKCERVDVLCYENHVLKIRNGQTAPLGENKFVQWVLVSASSPPVAIFVLSTFRSGVS